MFKCCFIGGGQSVCSSTTTGWGCQTFRTNDRFIHLQGCSTASKYICLRGHSAPLLKTPRPEADLLGLTDWSSQVCESMFIFSKVWKKVFQVSDRVDIKHCDIDIRINITLEELEREYIFQRKPVVLRDPEILKWRAFNQLTMELLVQPTTRSHKSRTQISFCAENGLEGLCVSGVRKDGDWETAVVWNENWRVPQVRREWEWDRWHAIVAGGHKVAWEIRELRVGSLWESLWSIKLLYLELDSGQDLKKCLASLTWLIAPFHQLETSFGPTTFRWKKYL